MKPYWSETLRGLSPYVPGEQPKQASLLKLNTNENPYAPSSAALAAIRTAADGDLRLYPDPDGSALKQAVAAAHGLDTANVFLGNGSDEVLAHAFLGLLKHPRPLLFPDITYSFYPVYCALYDIAYEEIPLDDEFRVRLGDYARPNGGIVLPNPNAPTGIALSRAELRTLLAGNPDSVVLVDEAYVDFGAESAVPLIGEFPNLLVTQTLSKSRALAGLRVGYALGAPDLIGALETVKGCFNSYPLDRLALAGATAALADNAWFADTCGKIATSRDWLTAELGKLGFEVLPSRANFVFARHATRSGASLQQALRERNVLVRRFDRPRIADFLRITVGTQAECETLLANLREIGLD